MLINGKYYVKPNSPSTHKKHTFYIRIDTSYNLRGEGGTYSRRYFGPYYLDNGCTTTSYTITGNPAFVSNPPTFYVGDNHIGWYTLSGPTTSKSYCVITSIDRKNTDGSTMSPDNIRDYGNRAQPIYTWDLWSKDWKTSFTFAYRVSFTGSK